LTRAVRTTHTTLVSTYSEEVLESGCAKSSGEGVVKRKAEGERGRGEDGVETRERRGMFSNGLGLGCEEGRRDEEECIDGEQAQCTDERETAASVSTPHPFLLMAPPKHPPRRAASQHAAHPPRLSWVQAASCELGAGRFPPYPRGGNSALRNQISTWRRPPPRCSCCSLTATTTVHFPNDLKVLLAITDVHRGMHTLCPTLATQLSAVYRIHRRSVSR